MLKKCVRRKAKKNTQGGGDLAVALVAVVSAGPRRMGGISTGRMCREGKGRLSSERGGAGEEWGVESVPLFIMCRCGEIG